jgi:DNA modification methylase
MEYKLILGDCLDKIKELEDNSIDSIVTDPPYGISFMGNKWDYDVPSVEIWKECFRVLKPGGHLLSFSSARTYHRMAINVEDAGFEIRDQIMWVFGSGFPKSLNVGKAIDKRGGNNLLALEISQKLKEARTKRKITLKQADEMFCNGSTNYSWYEGRPKGTRIPEIEDFKKIVDAWPEMKEYYDQTFPADRPVVDIVSKARNVDSSYAIPGLGSSTNYIDIRITEPATEEAKKWDGWGTALKPAHEPIVLARKPFRGDVASNVLEHGTGALNIDGCRVETTDSYSYPNGPKGNSFSVNQEPDNKRNEPVESNTLGRWPANFMHDGSDEVINNFPNTGSSTPSEKNKNGGEFPEDNTIKLGLKEIQRTGFLDSGSAARYFYCAKASKQDRNEGCEDLEEKEIGRKGNGLARTCETCGANTLQGCECEDRTYSNPKLKNHHPTVKPTELMRYLCRLITSKNGTILDPFMGSGSTGKAAILEGYNFIGIELSEEYLDIARNRIKHAITKK